MRWIKISLAILASFSVLLLAACTTPSPTTTTTPTTTTSGATTYQSLSVSGQVVYTANCAICHGSSGQGVAPYPALWGSGFVVGQYNGITLFAANAQAMLSFMSTTMPFSAPGSLSHEQYIDVLCYLLIQEGQVSPSATFDESLLSGITLK